MWVQASSASADLALFRIDDVENLCAFGREAPVCTKSEQAIARVDVMLNWFGKLKQ